MQGLEPADPDRVRLRRTKAPGNAAPVQKTNSRDFSCSRERGQANNRA
jgi:hypothetical protein